MRIALVAPFGLRVKGTTRGRALPLARALVRRGHEVALFVPPYDCPEDSGREWWEPRGDSSLPAIAQNDRTDAGAQGDGASGDAQGCPAVGVRVVNVVLPRRAVGSAGWYVWIAWRLLGSVRSWRPEVVHIFKPKGPSGLVGMGFWALRGWGRAAAGRRGDAGAGTRGPGDVGRADGSSRATRLPLFALPHPRLIVDADDWEGPGGWNDDPRAGYSAVQRWFFARQERIGLAHADAWTVASECLRQRAVSLGAGPARVFMLPNGVSGSRPPHSPEAGAACSVLLYTRFAGVRPAEVAAIWARVRETCPDAMLEVAGRGLAGEEAQLAGLPGVAVSGWVEPAAQPARFARSGVAVVPWDDTPANRARSSVKVRELMAAGLPIVAYAVGELPDLIGAGGLLAPPGDRDAFAAAVIRLLRDPAQAACLGRAAQRRAEMTCGWDDLALTALAAYATEFT